MIMGPPTASAGDTLTVTITLRNPGPDLPDVTLENPLPPQLNYAGGLSASSGLATVTAGAITWAGAVNAATPVTISYQATVNASITTPTLITNEAVLDDGQGASMTLSTLLMANGQLHYLPLLHYRHPE